MVNKKNGFVPGVLGGQCCDAEVAARRNEKAWGFKDIPKKDPYPKSFTDFLA